MLRAAESAGRPREEGGQTPPTPGVRAGPEQPRPEALASGDRQGAGGIAAGPSRPLPPTRSLQSIPAAGTFQACVHLRLCPAHTLLTPGLEMLHQRPLKPPLSTATDPAVACSPACREAGASTGGSGLTPQPAPSPGPSAFSEQERALGVALGTWPQPHIPQGEGS